MKKSTSEKLNILKNSSGFSIVELLLALALLLIALGLGYNLLFFARNSFERSEERWMEQNEVVSVSSIFYDALNEAYYVEIVPDVSSIPTDLPYYGAFYVVSGQTIYQSKIPDSAATLTQLPGDGLTVNFALETYPTDDGPYPYNDLINVTVVSKDLNYTLSNSVHLDNMNRDKTVHYDKLPDDVIFGPVIVFQTKEVVSTIPASLYDSLCFIATASYGSPMDPSVRLLRRFRDDVLLETVVGTKFVEFYYENSPPVAEVIAQSPVLRFVTRAVLYPVVGLVSMVMNPLHLLSVLAGIFITLVIFKKK